MTSSRVALVLAFFTVVQGSGDVLQTSLRPSITPSIKPSAQTGTDSTTHETVGRRLGATASPSASVPPTATSVPTTIPTVTIAPTSCCDSNDGATDAKGNSCLAYEYKVYACQTQDSFNFSASEMCCACGGGSGVVTGCAAEVTTKGPSVAPTVLPRLTVVPPTLELQVVKPFEVEGVFYLVNLNRHTLSWSSNILKTRLNSSNIVISTASTMSLGDGENAELNVKFLSSDVLPGKYTTELEIETHAENMSMITTEYMNVTLMVTAVAAESQSRCIISTRPTLGSLWDGIAIKTYDSDANRLTDDTNEDLRVSLKRLSNNYSVVICSVSWDDDRYVAKCDVPQSDQAGNWTVEVELNDQMICEEDVGMDCPKHEYETGEGTCKICMEGADCGVGSRIRTLKIDERYWRCCAESELVFPCSSDGCPGGTRYGSNNCNEGYSGALCDVCDRGYTLHFGEDTTCDKCNTDLLTVLRRDNVVLAACAAVAVLGGGLYYAVGHSPACAAAGAATLQMLRQTRSISFCYPVHRLIEVLQHEIATKQAMIKLEIILYALQVIYQYTMIVTGHEIDFKLPGPIKHFIALLGPIGALEVFRFFQLDCWYANNNYYTKLVLSTLAPFAVCALVFVWFMVVRPSCRRRRGGQQAASEQHPLTLSLGVCIFFLEFVLSAVSATIFNTFSCRDFGDEHLFLAEDLTVSCDSDDASRQFWTGYALLCVLVYPVGVPLLLFVALYHFKDQIKHAMEKEFEEAHKSGRARSPSIILREDSRVQSAEGAAPTGAPLLAFRRLFDKYEGRAFWFGIFIIVIRLLETSFLVFFHKRVTKTLFATGIAFIGVVVQREQSPYIFESDDSVSTFATLVVFIWLFALQAFDALQATLPSWVWSSLLVLLVNGLIIFSIAKAFSDVRRTPRPKLNNGNRDDSSVMDVPENDERGEDNQQASSSWDGAAARQQSAIEIRATPAAAPPTGNSFRTTANPMRL